MMINNRGHVRLFVHSSTANSWNQLGSALVGLASCDKFETSVSTSADGVNVAVGAPCNSDDGTRSGHVRILRMLHAILVKECGWCVNQFGNVQDDGKVKSKVLLRLLFMQKNNLLFNF